MFSVDHPAWHAPTAEAGPRALPPVMRVFRERWWIIVLTTLVGVVLAGAYVSTATKSYQATSSVLVQSSSPISAALDPGSSAGADPTSEEATDLLLITSGAVADAAQASLGNKLSASQILSEISASEEPNSDLYAITAADASPARAAKVANAVANAFVTYLGQVVQHDAVSAEASLKQRMATLPADDTSAISQLKSALSTLYELAAAQTGDATVVATAAPPATASSPKPKLDIALGVVLGLALGIGIAFLVDLVDRRLRDDEAFERAYGLSTLVHVPSRSMTKSGLQVSSPAFEPYRILGSTLAFWGTMSVSNRTTSVHSVLITSAVAGEGKTTVAAGLAMALADSGHTVTLVALDESHPNSAPHFLLRGDAGLTTALLGGERVENLLQQPIPTLPTLNVLPGGPRIPLELLRSPAMDQAMERLRAISDIVIYDGPSILGVAAAQALLGHPQIEAAVIVCRAYKTTRDQAERTRAILDQRLVDPLGLVLTGLDEPGAGAAHYADRQQRQDVPQPGIAAAQRLPT